MENEAQNVDKVRKEMQSKICTYSGPVKIVLSQVLMSHHPTPPNRASADVSFYLTGKTPQEENGLFPLAV